MRLTFRSAALAIVVIAAPGLAMSTTAAAASRSPARAPVRGAATGLRDSPGAPSARVPGGTQVWRGAYSLGFGGSATAVAVSPDSSTVFVTGSVNGPHGHAQIATAAYRAATGARLWVARYHGPVNTNSTAASIVVSPDGAAVYITGGTAAKSSQSNGVTIAYSAASGAATWTELYTSPSGLSSADAVAVSPDGATVFITGTSGAGLATLAYNAASGATRWIAEYSNPLRVGGGADALAVSPDGATVYVAGGVSLPSGAGDSEYATVAYRAATGAMRWVRLQAGTAGPIGDRSAADALAVSPDGATVFVTGALTTKFGSGYGTVAYAAADGTKLWSRLYDRPPTQVRGDGASSIAISPDGSTVFVTGSADGDYATVAYATAGGAQRWASRYQGEFSGANSVTASPDGSTVFVTGQNAKAQTSSQIATVAYAAATGATVWVRRYPGASRPAAGGDGRSVAVSPDGAEVFVAGSAGNPAPQPSGFTTIAYHP